MSPMLPVWKSMLWVFLMAFAMASATYFCKEVESKVTEFINIARLRTIGIALWDELRYNSYQGGNLPSHQCLQLVHQCMPMDTRCMVHMCADPGKQWSCFYSYLCRRPELLFLAQKRLLPLHKYYCKDLSWHHSLKPNNFSSGTISYWQNEGYTATDTDIGPAEIKHEIWMGIAL